MNTNGMDFDALLALQAEAREAMKLLPKATSDYFYARAQRRYASCGWDWFTTNAKADCALLEYIETLPERRDERTTGE
jgi:hypothetical protein